MGPLEAADVVVVAAEHVRRPREQLEILGAPSAPRPIGGRQRLERVEPRAAGVGLTAPFELGQSARHGLIIPCRATQASPMSRDYGLFLFWFWF